MSRSLEPQLRLSAYNHLCAALGQPYNPGSCSTMLLGCFAAATEENGDLSDYYLEVDVGHKVLNLCIAFMTAPRSPRQLAQLQTSLECHCEDVRPLRASQLLEYSVHRLTWERFAFYKAKRMTHLDGLLEAFVSILDNALVSTLEGGIAVYKVQRRLKKFASTRHSTTRKPWPEHPLQLVPHGAEDSIRGLLGWVHSPESPLLIFVTDFVSHIVMATKQLVIPYIVTAHRFSYAVFKLLEGHYERWHDDRSQIPHSAAEQKDALKLLRVTSGFFQRIYARADFVQLKCFFSGDGKGLENCFAILFMPLLLWVGEVADEGGPLSEAQQVVIKDLRESFALAAAHVYTYFKSTRHLYVYEMEEEAKRLEEVRKAPVSAAFLALLHLDVAERCAAPECTATYAAAGRKFPRCVGCWRASYCSETCQRASWRHRSVPHKPVCKFMREVAEAGLVGRKVKPSSHLDFVSAYSPDVLKRPGMARALEVVAKHVEALQTAKMSTPGFRSEDQWMLDIENRRMTHTW